MQAGRLKETHYHWKKNGSKLHIIVAQEVELEGDNYLSPVRYCVTNLQPLGGAVTVLLFIGWLTLHSF